MKAAPQLCWPVISTVTGSRFVTVPRTETVVTVGWLTLTALAIWFAWHYRGTVPSGDEWWDVPVACGEFPLSWQYLWGAANDHRCPLTRLLYTAILRATGFEVRVIAVLNVVVLATAAGAILRGLRHRRGRSSVTDLAAPLALTNVGMWEPYLWSSLFPLALGTTLAIIALLVTTAGDWPPSRGRVVLVGLLGLACVGCGGAGLPYAAVLAVWLGGVGVVLWRAGRIRAAGLALVFAVGVSTAVGLYFVPDGSVPPNPSRGVAPARIIQVALQFVAVGFGPVGFRWWPGDPAAWPLLGAVTVGLIGWIAVTLLWHRHRLGPGGLAGFGCVLAGFAVMALGLAASRGGDSPAPGYGPRYTVLAVAGVCWLVVAAASVGTRSGRIVSWLLVLGTAAVWIPSYQWARRGAWDQKRWLQQFAADVRAGIPVDFLAERYSALAGGYSEYLADRMIGLRAATVKPFDQLKLAQRFAEIPVSGVCDRSSPDVLSLRLTERRTAKGIQIRYSFDDPRSVCRLLVEADAGMHWHSFRTGSDIITRVWVDGPVERLRIRVPSDRHFVVHEVHVLTVLDPSGV